MLAAGRRSKVGPARPSRDSALSIPRGVWRGPARRPWEAGLRPQPATPCSGRCLCLLSGCLLEKGCRRFGNCSLWRVAWKADWAAHGLGRASALGPGTRGWPARPWSLAWGVESGNAHTGWPGGKREPAPDVCLGSCWLPDFRYRVTFSAGHLRKVWRGPMSPTDPLASTQQRVCRPQRGITKVLSPWAWGQQPPSEQCRLLGDGGGEVTAS